MKCRICGKEFEKPKGMVWGAAICRRFNPSQVCKECQQENVKGFRKIE